MGSRGIISGALGGLAGFGRGMTELAADKRRELAERLRMQMIEEANIRGEGRDEARAIAAEDRAQKRPMSVAEQERINAELTAENSAADYKNKMPLGQSEQDRLEIERKNRMAEITEQGKIQIEVANIRSEGGTEENANVRKLKNQEQLQRIAVMLNREGLPIQFNPETGAIESTAGLTQEQLKKADELAAKYGYALSVGDEQKQDRKGWFSGSDNVRPITGVARMYGEGSEAVVTSETATKTPAGKDPGLYVKDLTSELDATNPENAKNAGDGNAPGLIRKKIDPESGRPEPDKPKGVNIDKYGRVFEKDGVIWGVTKDGKTERVMVKPSERIYNNQYPNPEYAVYQELLRRIKK